MATPTGKCLLSAVFSLNIAIFCANFISFFDLDELDDVKYGIDISNTPILSGQDTENIIMHMKSKYGQHYECRLPDMGDYEKDHEEQKLASEIGISELLKPMEVSPCLLKTKGWWTYEFCYSKGIRQYHMEDGKIVSDIISLGEFYSQMDWNNQSHAETKRHKINRYHSHLYKNGSVCDLTGRQRESEVRFMCVEEDADTIHRVDEPSSCTYLITIHTNRVCKHPYLRPPASHKPKPILCYPALDEEQFDMYSEKKQQEEEERIEQQSKKMKEFQDALVKQKAQLERAEALLKSQNERNNILESHDIILSKTHLYQSMSNKIEILSETMKSFKEGIPQKDMETYEMKTREDLAEIIFGLAYDLDSLLHILMDDDVLSTTLTDELEEIVNDLHAFATNLNKPVGEEITEDEIVKISHLYDDSVSLISVLKKLAGDEATLDDSKLAFFDGEIEAEFETIEELEEWLTNIADVVGNIVDANTMVSDQSGGHKGLAEQLRSIEDKTRQVPKDTHEKTIATEEKRRDEDVDTTDDDDWDDEEEEDQEEQEDEEEEEGESHDMKDDEDDLLIKEFQEGLDDIKPNKQKLAKMSDKLHEKILDQFDEILAEAREEFKEENIFDDIDHKIAAKKLATTLAKLMKSINEKEEIDDNKMLEEEGKSKKDDEENPDNKQVASISSGEVEEDERLDDDRVRVRVTKVNIAGDKISKESEIYDSKYRKIEQAVQDHLENAGINPEGKIEVKIIAYDPNEDENGMTILTEEESTYFKDMIVGLLGGGKESTHEELRQQRLEDNYKFVWGDSTSKLSQTEGDETE